MGRPDDGNRPVVVILLACRLPDRSATHLPPALEILDGVPLVLMAARELREVPDLSDARILVLAPLGSAAHVQSALAELSDLVTVIEGGDSADVSIHLALQLLPLDADATVLIHDACRPLTPASQIDRVLQTCLDHDGQPVIPVLPMTESVKVLDEGGRIVRTIVRESVVRVQAPQAARLSAVRAAHADCASDRGPDVTYFVATGQDTQLVAGDELGLPVISAGDRELATVLRRRGSRRGETVAG